MAMFPAVPLTLKEAVKATFGLVRPTGRLLAATVPNCEMAGKAQAAFS
jgi:hypothetical protein